MKSVNEYIIQECFAMNLKWFRLQNNLTQEQLAEMSNLTAKYISDLERGKYSPSLSRIQDIAKALNVEPHVLLMNNQKVKS